MTSKKEILLLLQSIIYESKMKKKEFVPLTQKKTCAPSEHTFFSLRHRRLMIVSRLMFFNFAIQFCEITGGEFFSAETE
ncbi:hypothetical protein CHH68_14110 [Bacillus velezensis]|nr:hypothetical protein CHH68_14110 [Bacillus velezensis]